MTGVQILIPRIKSETFAGLHLLFSSVIPLETPPETCVVSLRDQVCRMFIEAAIRSEFWRMARAFGATCHKELSSRVTHVIAAKVPHLPLRVLDMDC